MSGRGRLIGRLAVRDMRRHGGDAALLAVAIIVAATTLTLALLLHGETAHPYQETKSATAGPDVVANVFPSAPGQRITAAQLTTLAALAHAHGVLAFSGPYPVTWAPLRVAGHTVAAQIEGRDPAPAVVDQPVLTSGSWVRTGAVVVERSFAQALGLHVGDAVQLSGHTFRVVGIAVTAAFSPYPQLCAGSCVLSNPQLTTTNPGLVWVTRPEAAALAATGEPVTYFANLKLSNPSAATGFAAHYNAAASPQDPVLAPWQQISEEDARLIHNQQVALTVGSSLLGVLALATVSVLVATRMSEQTRRVGLLTAAGAGPWLVSVLILAEQLAVTVVAAAAGLIIGRFVAPVLTRPGAGLLGAAGAPPLTIADAAVVIGAAAALTFLATAIPAYRAVGRTTLNALLQPPRPPRRGRALIAASARLPVTMMLGIRLAARRPRRTLLAALAVTVAVAGAVVIMYAQTNLTMHQSATAGLTDPRTQRLDQVMLAITILLILMAGVNLVFVTNATASDARPSLAVARAVGASPSESALGLAAAQLLPATLGAILGIPIGAALFAVLSRDSGNASPPWWWLAAAVPSTMLLTLALTTPPAMAESKRSIAGILQAEHP
jgi:ABC-type antimicrobial peptide transport system permease subunit